MSTSHTSKDAARHSLVIGFAIIGMITATGLFLLPTNSTAEKQGAEKIININTATFFTYFPLFPCRRAQWAK